MPGVPLACLGYFRFILPRCCLCQLVALGYGLFQILLKKWRHVKKWRRVRHVKRWGQVRHVNRWGHVRHVKKWWHVRHVKNEGT